jgi:NADH dehydrogenase/NADH:ubiquinone oxidoreductase subunit G
MTVTITVDGKPLEVKADLSLLQACLENGIYIPNLCFLEDAPAPQASCRLCFVEVAGMNQPVTACTVKVADQMVVHTDTPNVRRLQKTGLRLLLSVHAVDCKNCPANKNCVLQDLAKFLKVGLKPKTLEHHLKEPDVDESHPHLIHYPNRCVLCGKCLQVCRHANGSAMLAFAQRGFDTVISFYGDTESQEPACDSCQACIDICPVAALLPKHAV